MHLFAIVANNAYLCLVLADEICYGISSLGLEAKDCETAKGLHILLWIKKALTIRFVFWHLEIWTISWLFQTHCSSGRPLYGMNTCHTLIVSWRQALCPVVRMLDRVYYIIKVGLHTARFMDKGNAKTSETGTSEIAQAPLFLYPQFRRSHLGWTSLACCNQE